MEVFKIFATMALIDNISRPLKGITEAMDRAKIGSNALSRNLVTAATSMESLAKGAAITTVFFGKTVAVAAGFEQAMAGVGAVSQATAAELAQMSDQARMLGATTVFSASEAAGAQKQLAQAGFAVQENLAALPGVLSLASATTTDLARTTDVAANTLRAFALPASEMARVADVLAFATIKSNTNLDMLGDTMKFVAPIARKAGMSIEETAAMAGVLGNFGIQGGMAGTVLRSSLSRLAAPAGEAAKKLKDLGVEVKIGGKMRGMVAILGDMSKSMTGMGNAEQLAALKMIFGEEAMSGMAAAIEKDGLSALTALTNGLGLAAGTTERLAAMQNNTLHGSLKSLGSAWESLQITIGKLFLPVVRLAADAATWLVAKLDALSKTTVGAAMLRLLAILSGSVLGFVGFAMVLGKVVVLLPALNAGFLAVGSVLGLVSGPIWLLIAAVAALGIAWKFNLWGMQDKITNLWNKVSLAGKGIIAILSSVDSNGVGKLNAAMAKEIKAAGLMGIVTTASRVLWRVKLLFDGVWSEVVKTFEPVLEIYGDYFAVLGELFAPLLNIFKPLIAIAADWLGLASGSGSDGWVTFGQLIGSALMLPVKAGLFVIFLFTDMLRTLISVRSALVEFFTTTVPKAIDTFLDYASVAFHLGKQYIVGLFDEIGAYFTNDLPLLFNNALGKITAFGTSIYTWVGETFTSVKNYIIDAIAGIDLLESGKKMIETLGRGILSVATLPANAIAQVLAGVRDYLPFSDAKIGPLSTLTLSGQRLLETLGHGIELGAGDLSRTINDSLTLAIPDAGDPNRPAAAVVPSDRRSGSRSTTINIQRIELPGVRDGATFVEELKRTLESLVLTLEGEKA